MTLLALDRLTVTAGSRVLLRDVSLQLAPSEILGLVGESGSGKSTLALAVSGLLPAQATRTGRILLEGEDLGALSDEALTRVRGRRIGLVFQEPATALNPLHTILDQVAETVLAHREVSRGEARAQAAAMLERVGLSATRVPHDRYPHELSGGQRQRVAIALATVLTPRLLLADEPTTALDVTTQALVLDLLRGLAREQGQALLLISHDLAVVASLADRIALLKQGELVEIGPAREVLRAPRHAYTRALLEHSRPVQIATRPAGVAGSTAPLVVAEGVAHEYLSAGRSSRVLDDVALSFTPGERVGLVGESGSGKTTLVRLLLGLERPTAGTVRVAGEQIESARGAAARRWRRQLQAVFQDPYGSLNPRHRVERIVAEPLHLLDRRPSTTEIRERVAAVLTNVGLDPARADRYPQQFSGGERQRIAIARALIVAPAFVIFDEAVSALDVASRAQVLALLARLWTESGLGYLFVSHDLTLVRAITDRVLVLKAGRIVEQGPTATVLFAPQHEYTRELLAATPDLAAALAGGGT